MDTRPGSGPWRRSGGAVRLDRLARDCLGPAIARYGFGSAEILAAWPEIVGAGLAGRTRPERVRWPRLRDGTAPEQAAALLIRAEGADAIELQHLAPQILDRLNAFFGWRAIGRLTVRQGPVAVRPAAGPAQADEPSTAPAPEASLSAIEDPALRAAFERLGRHVAAERDKST